MRFLCLMCLAILGTIDFAGAQICDRWVKVGDLGYSPSDYHNAVYDPQAQLTIMTTPGHVTNTFMETSAWNGTAWSLLAANGPKQRLDSALAYDPDRGRTVFMAGLDPKTGSGIQDTWEWDGALWTEVDFGHNAPVTGPDAAYDSWRNVTVLWGGAYDDKFPEDVFVWNGAEWTELPTVVPSPIGRARHVLTFDAARGVMVMHAGIRGSYFSDTWNL